MPVAAVVDKGGLQRWLDPHDLGEINIAAKLFLAGGFEIEFLDPVTAKDHHSGFFGVRRIDEHFVGHVKLVQARRAKGQCRRPRSAKRTPRPGVAGARPHHAMDGRVSEKRRCGAAKRAAARHSATGQTGTRRAALGTSGPAAPVREATATHQLGKHAFGSDNRDWPRNREDAIADWTGGR